MKEKGKMPKTVSFHCRTNTILWSNSDLASNGLFDVFAKNELIPQLLLQFSGKTYMR